MLIGLFAIPVGFLRKLTERLPTQHELFLSSLRWSDCVGQGWSVSTGGTWSAYSGEQWSVSPAHTNLWQKRLEAYTKFVKLTSLFPKYPFRKEVDWQDVLKMSLDFRDWYFEGNGILISRDFRKMYFAFQKYIITTLTSDKMNNNTKLDDKEYDCFQAKCSLLRTLMARELESRENPIWHRFKKQKDA